MRTIAACHKVFTENNGLEVNISATIKRRKMINTRTLSQAAAHKPDFSTPGILQTRSAETLLYAYFFAGRGKNALQQNFFSFSSLPGVQKNARLSSGSLLSPNKKQARSGREFAGIV
ncbi:MAG: hypothetical protein E6559_17995 [Pantoea sp.]|uniref:hypothetical protein n=1 Tax=Pantoea septica TaxID=472695 RepID=UPI001C10C28B|nr:hypothetical protein [Pantoea septica]MBU5379931.1 hypothetical protein [Pantoea septica]MDU6441755.1 hypothetical protein [Pantoea sp.]